MDLDKKLYNHDAHLKFKEYRLVFDADLPLNEIIRYMNICGVSSEKYP